MIRFRMPTTAVLHSEDVFNLVGNFNLSIITDKFANSSLKWMLSSKVLTNCMAECMGYTSETRESLPTKIRAMVAPESMEGVLEKMVSVATASFLYGILKAGNLDLKCFLMGYLVDVTTH